MCGYPGSAATGGTNAARRPGPPHVCQLRTRDQALSPVARLVEEVNDRDASSITSESDTLA